MVVAVTTMAAACSSDGSDSEADPVTVQARLLPPLAAPGASVRPADDAEVIVEGTVAPANAGEKVTLQVRDGDAWKDLTAAEQDGQGRVEIPAPYLEDGKPQTYRLVGGAGAVSENLDTDTWRSKLLFEDEFAGDALDPRWTLRVQDYGEVEGRACTKSDLSASTVADGVLSLSVALDPAKSGRCRYEGQDYGYRHISNIGTEASFSFTYGFAAARMKFHRDRGQHAAFWMQPTVPPSSDGPETGGAEIDIIEWFGDKHPSGGLSNYVYYNDGGKGVKAGSWIKNPDRFGDDWWRKYHVFSVEWSPDGYVFRIDGQIAGTIDGGASGVPQFLILSNISSNYELPHLPSEDDLPQTTDVDWVRVWSP